MVVFIINYSGYLDHRSDEIPVVGLRISGQPDTGLWRVDCHRDHHLHLCRWRPERALSDTGQSNGLLNCYWIGGGTIPALAGQVTKRGWQLAADHALSLTTIRPGPIYGERDDPVTVLSRLGKQLELAIPQHSVLPELVETVAETLKLPYVGISLETNGELVTAAEYGRRSQSQVALPLVFQGEDIGKLTVAQRSSGEPFNPSEMALLENIARQAGAAAQSVQLTADLRRSRQRLVTAREEERRRLRRDLHDGLGPALAAHQLKIGSARALLDRDPEKVQQILDGLEHDVGETLSQIRHLVYGLRPPELDQLGLLAAVEQSINRHRTASEHTKQEGKVRIDVTLPDELPLLPAAVEVAAYRIVQEGLNNVLQHAKASQCQINFRLENGFLYVEIADNGVGLSKDRPAGVGLTSMRERTEELGGVIDISGKIGRGTQVMARLPVPHWEQDGLER